MTDADIILGVGLLSLIIGVFGFALRTIPWEVAHRVDLRQLSMLFTVGGVCLLFVYFSFAREVSVLRHGGCRLDNDGHVGLGPFVAHHVELIGCRLLEGVLPGLIHV